MSDPLSGKKLLHNKLALGRRYLLGLGAAVAVLAAGEELVRRNWPSSVAPSSQPAQQDLSAPAMAVAAILNSQYNDPSFSPWHVVEDTATRQAAFLRPGEMEVSFSRNCKGEVGGTSVTVWEALRWDGHKLQASAGTNADDEVARGNDQMTAEERRVVAEILSPAIPLLTKEYAAFAATMQSNRDITHHNGVLADIVKKLKPTDTISYNIGILPSEDRFFEISRTVAQTINGLPVQITQNFTYDQNTRTWSIRAHDFSSEGYGVDAKSRNLLRIQRAATISGDPKVQQALKLWADHHPLGRHPEDRPPSIPAPSLKPR